jgi:hypothetical protein
LLDSYIVWKPTAFAVGPEKSASLVILAWQAFRTLIPSRRHPDSIRKASLLNTTAHMENEPLNLVFRRDYQTTFLPHSSTNPDTNQFLSKLFFI